MDRKRQYIFAILLFLAVAGFFGLFAWYEYANRSNSEDLDKKMADDINAGSNPIYIGSQKFGETAANTGVANTQTTPLQAPAPDPTATSDTAPQEAATAPDTTGSTQPDTTTQTFKDVQMNITFDYDTGNQVSEKNGQVIVTGTDASWELKIYDNPKKKNIMDWYDDNYSGGINTGCTAVEATTLKIGSFDTQQVKAGSSGTCDDGAYFARSDDKTEIIRVILDKGTEDDANKILDTFKFIKT